MKTHRGVQDDSWLQSFRSSANTVNTVLSMRTKRISYIAYAILLFVGIGILFEMINVQVRNHSLYARLANGNRVRERVIYAKRGRILDKHGAVLAESRLATQLVVYPYLLPQQKSQRGMYLAKVAAALGWSEAQLTNRINKLSQQDVRANVVSSQLSQESIIRLEEILSGVQAFELQDIPSRTYYSADAVGTVIGYTGQVTAELLEQDKTKELLPTDQIGREGIEATFDTVLRGKNGREKIEVDAAGRPVGLLARQSPVAGQDVTLTIDMALQRSLSQALQKQVDASGSPRASGVILDPNSGDVLAMVSLPNYDNNEFVGGISSQRYDELNKDPRQPLVNKAITNGYPSGSIIKPLVASAALQERIITPQTTIVDKGFIELRSQVDPTVTYRYYGWNHNGLGAMQLRSALAYSSNIYFFTVGGGHQAQRGLGIDRLDQYYRMFGLGARTGIRLPHEWAGRVPDPEWKKQTLNEPWFLGDTYNLSIGQGDLAVTPLQISLAEAAIVNDGYLFTPRISLNEAVASKELPIQKSHLAEIRAGMRQVVESAATSPSALKKLPVPVAGKSGTAETDTRGGRWPHSWYVGYAPYDKPQYLITVLVEEGKDGVSYSGAAVADTLTSIFSGGQR